MLNTPVAAVQNNGQRSSDDPKTPRQGTRKTPRQQARAKLAADQAKGLKQALDTRKAKDRRGGGARASSRWPSSRSERGAKALAEQRAECLEAAVEVAGKFHKASLTTTRAGPGPARGARRLRRRSSRARAPVDVVRSFAAASVLRRRYFVQGAATAGAPRPLP